MPFKDYKKSVILVLLLLNINLVSAKLLPDTLIRVKIDLSKKAQIIDNIGSSGCWFSEGIGKYWPSEKKEKIAELLFSQNFDANGKPQGIGLSAWRFNIGAGTAEQGDNSGIRDFRRRADSFLNPDGTYDWEKQKGHQFFLQKAHDYGVETLIAFSNSPPVQFTKNGLGFKTEKDFVANLKEDFYDDYASFLAQVIKHFDQKGLRFKYVSPVNEPQWDWYHKFNEATQEGSPWTNAEIFSITKALNTSLTKEKLDTKILLTEAAALNYLYGGSGKAAKQIQNFFDPKSKWYVGKFSNVPKLVAGHSYFTDSDEQTLLNTRKQLADTTKKYNVNFWQSEYSMLADGFKEGTTGNRTAMDCALFLAKVIHTDLAIANATAWQFWNAYEPGRADFNTRYYLIALKPKPDFKDGEFTVTKNLWALGHYSRFVRPGMQRVLATTYQSQQQIVNKNLMISSYVDKDNKVVTVAINYGEKPIQIELAVTNSTKKYATVLTYLTSAAAGADMKAQPQQKSTDQISLPARSIATIIVQ
jgi:O-glycosyl hydrolase